MPHLEWTNKTQAIAQAADVPYHLLRFERGYGDASADNLLIRGDNLLALKALLPFYRGRVKCIYIDPPYNTQSAFEHYDDKLEHSQWLSLMYPRLVLLRELLAEDGSIWVSIDDNELAYLIAIADEIFGRKNRISISTFKQSSISGPKAINPGVVSIASYVITYAKNKSQWSNKKIYTKRERDSRYNKFINKNSENESDWTVINLLEAFAAKYNSTKKEIKKMFADKYEEKLHEFVLENADKVIRTARVAEKDIAESAKQALAKSNINNGSFFKANRENAPPQYFLNGEQVAFYESKTRIIDGVFCTAEALSNIWIDLLSNNIHNEGGVSFPDGKKPESLIKRVLEICTNSGDLVLDSFLGSGTTAAVAHKMGRRWIGVEMGEHAETHCIPRLEKVIAGEQGGISQTVGWQGGGGFRYYTLEEPVFLADGSINPAVRFAALAAYLWHFETGQAASRTFDSPFLGEHGGKAYYLLYNGILGDRRPEGGNVLTGAVLAQLLALHPHSGRKVIYGEMNRLGTARLVAEDIEFKQIPYDVRVR